MKNSLYKDLTVVIPSKGRPKQLSALLSYFEAKELACRILILESGNSYRCLLHNFPKLKIDLYEFDLNMTLVQKVLSGAELVETPLVCLCPDDDLVLQEGIEECGDFLLKNPDYSACQGYHSLFEAKDSDFYLFPILWFTPSLDASDPLQRLRNLIERYHPVYWALFRTEVYKRMNRTFPDLQTPLFSELFISSMSAISGKVKRIPALYCLRANHALIPLGHPFYLFAESPQKFYKDYLAYRNSLEKTLNLAKESQRLLDLIHAHLFHSAFEPRALSHITGKLIEDPEASILKPEIYNAIKMPEHTFEPAKSLMVEHSGRRYHFAEKLLHPEAEEIQLPENFHLKLVKELETFDIS